MLPLDAKDPAFLALYREVRERSAELGKKLYEETGCVRCHGSLGRGDGPSAPTLKDDWGFPIRAANLSQRWTFRGGSSREDRNEPAVAGRSRLWPAKAGAIQPLKFPIELLDKAFEAVLAAERQINQALSVSPAQMPQLATIAEALTGVDLLQMVGLVLNDRAMTLRTDSVKEVETLGRLSRLDLTPGVEFDPAWLSEAQKTVVESAFVEAKQESEDHVRSTQPPMSGNWILSGAELMPDLKRLRQTGVLRPDDDRPRLRDLHGRGQVHPIGRSGPHRPPRCCARADMGVYRLRRESGPCDHGRRRDRACRRRLAHGAGTQAGAAS